MIEKINFIIDEFGGKSDIIFVGLFIFSFFLLSSLFRKKSIRIVFSIFTGLFVIMQITSLFFTQSFIGYQFFVHCNISGIEGMTGLFLPQIIISIVLLVGIIFFFYTSHTIIYKKFIPSCLSNLHLQKFRVISILIIFLSLGIIFSKSSFLPDTKSLLSIFYSNNTETFKKVLQKHGMTDYVIPNQIKSNKGENIIIISLESIERAYLEKKKSNLTPNLQEAKRKWNYYNLEENYGSNWTSGSLYTYLTGFPALFGLAGNSIFQTAYHSEISSISYVLEKAGYNTIYMNGNTNNSGVKEMLYAFHFNKIIDCKSVKTSGYESSYGLRDKDLFTLAKNEIKYQSSLKKPFALFISTTDTHFPDGIYDSRMEGLIPKKKSSLEFMVCALDYMVGDLISFIKKEGITDNTIVYIFPDHLKMGDPSMFSSTGKRGLYFITNAEKEDLVLDTTKKIYQIDLPKIILNGAKIKHNLKFLTDYIDGDKNDYIKNNIFSITEINTNGLSRYSH